MSSVTVQQIIAIAVTLALLLLVFELVRRKRLSERYAILWLLAALTLFVLAAWKGLLTSLAGDVGISYPPSFLFAVAIGLIAMILLNFSLVVSRLSDQNKILAQRLSLLQHRLDELEVQAETRPLGAQAEGQVSDGAKAARADSSAAAKELSRSR